MHVHGPEILEPVARWNEMLMEGSDKHVPRRGHVRLMVESLVRMLIPLL
jgi:hypothetical protein